MYEVLGGCPLNFTNPFANFEKFAAGDGAGKTL